MGFWALNLFLEDGPAATSKAGTDSATGSDASAITATVGVQLVGPFGIPAGVGSAFDSGTGTEGTPSVNVGVVSLSRSDTATGSETSSVTITRLPKSATDTGSFSESSSLQVNVTSAGVAVSDTGTGADSATVSSIVGVVFSTYDTTAPFITGGNQTAPYVSSGDQTAPFISP